MESRVVEKPFGQFERMLALRYLRAKREHGGLALISIVSVIGITLAVMALIVIMSIMNGFRLELLSKIIGFEPHAYVDTRSLPQSDVEKLMSDLATRPEVVSVEPMIEATALASAYGRSEGIQIRGVRPEDLRANNLVVEGMRNLANRGRPPGAIETFGAEGPLSKDVAVGAAFADALGLYVGDRLTLTQINGARTVLGQTPRTRTFTVSAIFHVGNERYDRYSIFLPIDSAASFFSQDGGYPIVGVRIRDPDAVQPFAAALMSDGVPYTQTWIDRNGTYVTALIVERNVMRLILLIVVGITSLNIITGVLMLVKNKARDVAILRTIGATRAGVVRVFLMTGSMLGSVGVIIGLTLGVLFCLYIAEIQHFLEGLFGFQLFPADVYMLDSIPAKLEPMEVVVVAIAAFLMSVATTLIPSMWASRLDPVEALRFQ
ncbi:MAG: lipoprotein-releasing ABC transporter permease subunit [Alphaproteobacteria bacterium]|nr:lipoprotein-releasing ABC transporter permease subunit [Alphaproteobacteria bacterium]